jgi:riboflavin biosynthesis pyrimidine reductase
VVIATASEDTIPGVEGDVEYARVGDDLPRLMAYLQERHAVRSVLCEGGPTLNSFLFAADIVDELFLTMTPKLVGGAAALTIVSGRELVEPLEPVVVSVAEADSELYTRWRFPRE